MKRYILIMVTAVLVLVSCDIETSDNGKLDGFWHLERVDTLDSGGAWDCSNEQIFWGVQMHLIEAKDFGHTDTIQRLYFRFRQTGDSLIINNVYENHWHEDNPDTNVGGDVPVETPNEHTRHYGINNIPEGFAKERLDGSRMVLKSNELRLTFRKF